MAVRFVAAPGPDLEELGLREHVFAREWEGRVLRCARCPLPRRNRIHVAPDEALRAEWRRVDAARLGERDL
jgi:hypothetical protein